MTGVARSGQLLKPVFLTYAFPSQICDNRLSRIRDNRPLSARGWNASAANALQLSVILSPRLNFVFDGKITGGTVKQEA